MRDSEWTGGSSGGALSAARVAPPEPAHPGVRCQRRHSGPQSDRGGDGLRRYNGLCAPIGLACAAAHRHRRGSAAHDLTTRPSRTSIAAWRKNTALRFTRASTAARGVTPHYVRPMVYPPRVGHAHHRDQAATARAACAVANPIGHFGDNVDDKRRQRFRRENQSQCVEFLEQQSPLARQAH